MGGWVNTFHQLGQHWSTNITCLRIYNIRIHRPISWVIMDDLQPNTPTGCEPGGSPKIPSAASQSSRPSPPHPGPHSSTSPNMVGPAHPTRTSHQGSHLSQLRAFYTWAHRRFDIAATTNHSILIPHVSQGFQGPLGKPTLTGSLLPEDLRRGVALSAYAGLRAARNSSTRVDRYRPGPPAAPGSWGRPENPRRRAQGHPDRPPAPQRSPALTFVVTGTAQNDERRHVPAAHQPGYASRRVRGHLPPAPPQVYALWPTRRPGDLVAVGRQMGHASPVTTAIYAASSDAAADVIAEAVAR